MAFPLIFALKRDPATGNALRKQIAALGDALPAAEMPCPNQAVQRCFGGKGQSLGGKHFGGGCPCSDLLMTGQHLKCHHLDKTHSNDVLLNAHHVECPVTADDCGWRPNLMAQRLVLLLSGQLCEEI